MVSQAGVALVSSFVVILGAGFPLTFSLYATSFQSVLGFSQTQVNTVNICNIIGQFICYPVIGALSDKYGANVVASLGAVFIIPGLLSAAVAYENRYSCAFLSTMFFFIGMGSTCGYITAVSTSARSLPNQKGLAISIPVCAYGLATLIYSVIFSQFFKTSQGYDIPAFWRSITIFVAFASIIGFFGMRVVVPSPTPQSRESDPLLQQQQQQDQYHGPEDAENSEGSAPLHRPPFFKDVTVVLYAIGYVLIAGSAETLVGNMGSILASIDASSQQPSQASTAVSLFAVFSTLSRLLIGWLSDALANKGLSRMTIPVFMVAVPMAIDFLALSLLPSTQTSFLIIVSINGFCYGSLVSHSFQIFQKTGIDFWDSTLQVRRLRLWCGD